MLEQWHVEGAAEGAAKGLETPTEGACWPRAREARN
jgi:hypothetical protein